MLRWKPIKTLLGGLLLTALCTGCMARSADGLYALPRQSDSYYDIQEAIDGVMTAGVSYAGPMTGSNQQAVQLADLDGDGQEEAIVFLKTGGEKPMKAYIFDHREESYQNVAVIESDGSDFDAVEYVDLDGQPGQEILLGRRLSGQILQSLGAYSYKDGHLTELMSVNYSEFAVVDLDEDDCQDVFVLRMDSDNRNGVAEIYRYDDGAMERTQEANLSPGALQIKRVISGYVAQGVPAVFVASAYEDDAIITDIFAYVGQHFRNVAVSASSGISAQTIRSYGVYAEDIDEDGVIELPMPVALPAATAAEETHWMIDWCSLSTNGSKNVKMTTYHNYAAGWYLVLPENWHDCLSVKESEELFGVRGTVFSKWNGYGQTPEEIVTIYGFVGEDRLELAQTNGRFLLAEKGEVAYSALLGPGSADMHITKEDLTTMFRFIYMDWNTGET